MTQNLILRRGESTYSVGSLKLFCETSSIDDYDSMIALANGDIDEYEGWTVEQYSSEKFVNLSQTITPDFIRAIQARLKPRQSVGTPKPIDGSQEAHSAPSDTTLECDGYHLGGEGLSVQDSLQESV